MEEIERDLPHPWDAPERVTCTFLHRGDRVDVIEEENFDPLMESLKRHVAAVNSELQVTFGCPSNIHYVTIWRSTADCGRRS